MCVEEKPPNKMELSDENNKKGIRKNKIKMYKM